MKKIISAFLVLGILCSISFAEIPVEVRTQLREDVKDVLESDGKTPTDDELRNIMESLESGLPIFEFTENELRDFMEDSDPPSDAEISNGFKKLEEFGLPLPTLLVYYAEKNSKRELTAKQKVLCQRMTIAAISSVEEAIESPKK